MITIIELLRFLQILANCIRNHHAEFEINMTVLECVNQLIKSQTSLCLKWTDVLLWIIELIRFLQGTKLLKDLTLKILTCQYERKKCYPLRSDGRTDPNYSKASLLKTIILITIFLYAVLSYNYNLQNWSVEKMLYV